MHAVLQAEECHAIGGNSCNGGRSSSNGSRTGTGSGGGGSGGCGGGDVTKGCDRIGGAGAGAGAGTAGAGADNDAANTLVDVGGSTTPTEEKNNKLSPCAGGVKSSCLKEACSASGIPGAAESVTVGGQEANGVGAGDGDAPAPAVAAAEAAAVAAMAARAAKVAAAAAAAGRGAAVLDDGNWLDMWTSLVNVLEVGAPRVAGFETVFVFYDWASLLGWGRVGLGGRWNWVGLRWSGEKFAVRVRRAR